MTLTESIVLLPCHSLEDFPTYHVGDDAEGLLAAWSALWHPALLSASLKMPAWRRADDPPTPQSGMLIVVPTVVRHELPSDYTDRALVSGAVLIEGLHRRRDIVERALAGIEPSTSEQAAGAAPGGLQVESAPQWDDVDLAADFLAVGVAHLLTELLTRRMRYMSNLDETAFNDAVLAAATAAKNGDADHARDHLRRACEVLYEARAHFYPVDTYLIDLTLVATTTIGASLRRELASDLPTNLLVAGQVIEEMATREPESLAMVQKRLAEQTVALIGGEYCEAELPLLPLETIRQEFARGRQAYQKYLGVVPDIFGRRRAGLTPALPQILRGFEYRGALHFTLDDGRFPQPDRSKALWEGLSATAIDAIGRPPLDAGEPASILTLIEKLGESMDYDFVSMISFAHWPALASEYYGDLRRISKYAAVLGRWISLEEFFTSTDSAGAFSKFSADQYRAPYLKQAVAIGDPDPLSRHVRRRADEYRRYACSAIDCWSALLAGVDRGSPVDALANVSSAEMSDDLTRQVETAKQALAATLCGRQSGGLEGLLLVNPHNISRRAAIDVAGLRTPPDVGGAVVAADASSAQAIVEVPPLGFAWVGPGQGQAKATKQRRTIARENVLTNELCEITIHPETGGIRGIRDLHARGNRLSQQLGMRLRGVMPMPSGMWRDPDEEAIYSQMVADSIEITADGAIVGEVTSRGRLLDPEGRELASFVQQSRLAAGRALLELEIELTIGEMPLGDPWDSYYACRFAWGEDLSEIRRSVHQAALVTDLKRLEAPDFVEIVGSKSQTAILTDGLPYHLRVGGRMLDSLLVVRGETRRRFRLAIALANPYPWQAAADTMSPVAVVEGRFPPPRGATSGWLFHLDSKAIDTTHWSPLVEEGAVVGFRVRLLELAGRGASLSLRTYRDVASACRITLSGETAEDLPVQGDRIQIEIGAFEWLELEARWTGG
jgi:alpha-mannosidase